jgi:hypothetical protein
MADRYDLDKTQSTRRAFAVTPSDVTVFSEPTRGLYIGATGTIRVMHADDTATTDYPVAVAGYVYPWSVKKVYASGTSASSIVAQL